MAKFTISPKFRLIWADLKRVAKNALIFSSPVLIIILTELQNGKSLEEIKPLVATVCIQIALDALKKFVAETKYAN